LLIIHGERDSVVPFAMGRKVFEAANQPKQFVAFPKAGHDDHYLFGSYEAVLSWLQQLGAAAGEAAVK
jgi:fermentation-respiration switch protein FrsA (DUF1100 family)